MRTTFKVGGTIVSALVTIGSQILTIRGLSVILGYKIDWHWFTLGG